MDSYKICQFNIRAESILYLLWLVIISLLLIDLHYLLEWDFERTYFLFDQMIVLIHRVDDLVEDNQIVFELLEIGGNSEC